MVRQGIVDSVCDKAGAQTERGDCSGEALSNNTLEIFHRSMSKMEDKSDCGPCEDGLSKRRRVRKGRPIRRTLVSVEAQTTITALSEQTKTSNLDLCEKKLVGCDGFPANLGNIKVKEENVSSKEEDTCSAKGEYKSSEVEVVYPVKGESMSSEEEDISSVKGEYVSSEEKDTSGKAENMSSGQEEETSLTVGNASCSRRGLRKTPDTRRKRGQHKLRSVIRREISEDLRRQVVEAHKNGKGYKRIAKDLDLHLSTVRTIVYKWKKFNTVVTLPRSGRPTKISAKARHTIFRHMRENTRVTVKDLKASLALDNINVHESTIRKTMSKWCSWDFTMEEATALQQE